MKSRILILITFMALAIVACQKKSPKQADAGSGEASTTTPVVAAPNVNGTFAIVPGSTLGWKGSKAVGKEHNGTIDIAIGSLTVNKGVLTGGGFVIDMTTIKDLDIESEKMNAMIYAVRR